MDSLVSRNRLDIHMGQPGNPNDLLGECIKFLKKCGLTIRIFGIHILFFCDSYCAFPLTADMLSPDSVTVGTEFLRGLWKLRLTELLNRGSNAMAEADGPDEVNRMWQQAVQGRQHVNAEARELQQAAKNDVSPHASQQLLQLEAAPPSNGASSSGFASPASALGKSRLISLYLVFPHKTSVEIL